MTNQQSNCKTLTSDDQTRTFTSDEQQIMIEELNKLQIGWLDYLEENDDDEHARLRLFVISWLKNAINAGYLDTLQIDFNDQILSIEVYE